MTYWSRELDRPAPSGLLPLVPSDDNLDDQLALARDLAARWLPRRGRRARRRLGAGDVLHVMRAVTDDASTSAVVELRFIVEELLTRGRREDGQRVTREDLIGARIRLGDGEP